MENDFKLFIDSAKRFIKKELTPHIEKLDLYPLEPPPLDIYKKLTEIMPLNEMDDNLLSAENLVSLLYDTSIECAGIASFAGYMFAGELFRRRTIPEIQFGLFAIALFEEKDIELERGMPLFSVTISNGRIKGIKKSVMLAPLADYIIVLSGENGGYYSAILERRNSKVSSPVTLTGIRAVPCADVEFNDSTAISVKRIDFQELLYILAIQSLFNTACALGTAFKALEIAWNYANERYQAGSIISKHDAIRLMYEKGISSILSHKRLLFTIAKDFDFKNTESMLEALRTKVNATPAALQATLDAIQMLGGYGYMRDYGIEKRFRDAVALSLLPVDNERIHLFLNAIRKYS